MALTGRTVQSSYLDLVQLEKSGAGLPSHAGKEAALYDGAGYQILGRTAVRHYMDPHPDAVSGTWEFSTYGDKTQAQLEAAGWTFTNCTASCGNGFLTLVATDTTPTAELSVSLSGDFDFVVASFDGMGYSAAANNDNYGVIKVLETGGSTYYTSGVQHIQGYTKNVRVMNGTASNQTIYGGPVVYRLARIGTTMYATAGQWHAVRIAADDANMANSGWCTPATATSVSATFNKLYLQMNISTAVSGQIVSFAFLRRFQ